MTNDLEIAAKFITDRKVNLVELSKETGISHTTLARFRHDPEQMRRASWDKVYQLAETAKKERMKNDHEKG
ncbi:helix-turn-helix domain-containing protein [Limosilactobacillus mucosae]|uniref:helix-turn-helix domain-containing protein n=1 Tax=Limosilactobacillus mucosae TaxID=97478 RepID=UPI003994EE44